MTIPTSAPPLPPDLLAKATEAIADGIYEDEHSAVIAEKVLRAVDVPGLLVLQATSSLFIQAVGRAASDTGWRKDGDETPGIADWIRLVAAERDRLLAEVERLRIELESNSRIYTRTDNDVAIVNALLAGSRQANGTIKKQRDEAREALAELLPLATRAVNATLDIDEIGSIQQAQRVLRKEGV